MGLATEAAKTVTIVVSNTGPLLHLNEALALELLPLAGQVNIPSFVQRELEQLDPKWHNPDWLRISDVQEPHRTVAFNWRQAGLLDAGEAEALALARQLGADWFLTDDAAARILARELGLEVHGSLGIVLWAAATGHTDRSTATLMLERLAHSSLWVSSRVLAEARNALDELFRE